MSDRWRDRSLDEFAEDDGSDEADADDSTASDDPVDSPSLTMRWDADAVCPACGAAAPRRWRDPDADRFVCADCVAW